MAANKKEYVIKINGVTQSLKEVTKLGDALDALDKSLEKTRTATVKAEASTKAKAKALSDEEKAAERLAATQKRIAAANSEANRAQIEANIALREATREVTRQIQIAQFAEGSIKQMGMTLTDLRNEYEELTTAQREDELVGGRLLEQIQALDAEYKALRESTGNFRDSVGNYEKATAGLNELKDRFELAARGSATLASDLAGSNDVLDAFGATTDVVAKSSEQLAGVMGLATIAQQAYIAVTQENIITQKAAAVVDGVRAIQLKAKAAAEALSTKSTWAAVIAQKALNLVAYANPYVLLAMAIVGVVGALAWFITRTDKAAENQKKLNDLQAIYLDQLDREADKLRRVGDERVKAAERALELLQAQGAATAKIRQAEDVLARERAANNAKLRGFYGQELSDLEKNQAQVEKLTAALAELNRQKAAGEESIKFDVDFDGKLDKVKIDDAIDAIQGKIDNVGRSVQIAVDLKSEQADIEQAAKVAAATRAKADSDAAKDRAAKAQEIRRTELAAVRAGEDARIALIADSYERERQTATANNRRAIEDLRDRLATEKDLTARARAAINDNIKALEKQLTIELDQLAEERQSKWLEIERATADSRLRLIVSESERQREELREGYDRQIEDLHVRFRTEKDLTQDEGQRLTEQMVNLRKERDRELAKMDADFLQQQADAAIAATDATLAAVEARTGEIVKRNKDGLELIDVKGTRANLKTVSDALGKYVDDVKKYQDDLTAAHDAVLATLQEGSPEYEAEVRKYADAMEAATQRIVNAQKKQQEAAKATANIQTEYFADLLGKVSEIGGEVANAIGSIGDTLSMGIQSQVDDMNKQLDTINERYVKATQQREAAADQVEELESRMQDATGGTADALREQLAEATAARNAANREEQRLAKEKEKREAEIARKEKQMRRNDLISSIAQGIANTAQGVTKALTLMWPLNLIMAPIIGGMGAVQVGIMTKQLAKLADGGPIEGPSHDDGGVHINIGGKPVYEAEGGEFMVNKMAYANNADLVEFINEQSGPISAADLLGFTGVPEGGPRRGASDDLVEAISKIEFKPVVAVQDIRDVEDNLVTVQDLAGF